MDATAAIEPTVLASGSTLDILSLLGERGVHPTIQESTLRMRGDENEKVQKYSYYEVLLEGRNVHI
jgi:hypothetical protein